MKRYLNCAAGNTLAVYAATLALTAVPATAQSADTSGGIVHDAEYYVLKAQNGENWAAEDIELQAKLAATLHEGQVVGFAERGTNVGERRDPGSQGLVHGLGRGIPIRQVVLKIETEPGDPQVLRGRGVERAGRPVSPPGDELVPVGPG